MHELAMTAGLAACVMLTACGPFIMLPGGRLSGQVEPPPADWTFTDDIRTFQVETRPNDPYSVNVWGVRVEDDFYIGTSPETSWGKYVAEDPEVRLRAGEAVYELRAEPATALGASDAFWSAVKAKYDFEADAEQKQQAIFFRLVPR